MSRQDTIMKTKWRVQVIRPDTTVSHEGLFEDGLQADNYYQSLDIAGSHARIQVRHAGLTRFKTIDQKAMPDGHSST